MSRLEKWILASRPKTLWAAVAPVIVGTAMAYETGLHHWPSALTALFCSLCIQVGTNLANDYFDHQKGADTPRRAGPLRVTQAGIIAPHAMRRAIMLVFFMACIGGLYLIWRSGWPAALIGIACIVSGLLYTAGPYPLGYLALGDIFVFLFFGPVAVGGTYYVQALELPLVVLLASLGPGFLTTAILTVNNLRDIEEDRQTGKRTLAVRLGKTFTRWEYAVLIVLGASTPTFLYLRSGDRAGTLLTLAVLPMAWPALRTLMARTDGPALNPVLAATARLLLIYSALFSAAWIF